MLSARPVTMDSTALLGQLKSWNICSLGSQSDAMRHSLDRKLSYTGKVFQPSMMSRGACEFKLQFLNPVAEFKHYQAVHVVEAN